MDDDDQQPLLSMNIQEVEMQERSVAMQERSVIEMQQRSVAKANESTSHALIDVEKLERIRLSGTELNKRSPSMCIFEVLKCLRDLDKAAYEPQVVGLGPYHHHTATLPRFKELKEEAVLRTLIKIYPGDPLGAAMENLRNEVMQMKQDIQDCYEITFPFDPDMFILDSCFLLQFLFPDDQKFDYPSGYDWSDCSGGFCLQIETDLMKLENQIPLILIQRLLLHLQRDSENDEIILNMACRLICRCLMVVSDEDIIQVLRKTEKKPGHLLEYGQQFVSHFVRDAATLPMNLEAEAVLNKCWRCFNRESMDAETWSFPRAHELEKAGIELKCGGTLSFEEKWYGLKGVLTIPALRIEDRTRVGIKNIIAFEESLPRKNRIVTGLSIFLDNLIDERADVEVLRRAGIIDNCLESDKAVAHVINSTVINVMCPDIWPRMNRMKVYYKSSWRVTIKEFMDTHISKPWVLIGTLSAIFLLVLTIVQTVYTVKSYKKG